MPIERLTAPHRTAFPRGLGPGGAHFEKPGGLGRILNVMGTLANHPGLFRRWVIFANHFLLKSTLTARAREILILRTGWLAGCAYEWGQHLEIAAADAAFGEAEFSALADGASSSLIVDQPPDDQAAEVEMTPRLGTARAPIEDREPAATR